MLYQAYQTQSDLMAPWRLFAQAGASAFWLGRTEGSPLRRLASALDVFSRLRLTVGIRYGREYAPGLRAELTGERVNNPIH